MDHVQVLVSVMGTVRLPGSENSLIHAWLPFGFLGVIAWSVWIGRRFLTALYRPVENDHWEKATVVAPTFREDPEILEAAVHSWLRSGVTEVILVFPDDEPDNLARAQDAFDLEPGVRLFTTGNPMKRNSLAIGITAASNPIVVLSDSDTLWEPDLLKRLLMPFADPQVGGVGSRQRVLDPDGSIWRRAAEWMLDSRYLTYIPAMARRGSVSCLSGRTVAYRREILVDVLPGLVGETFWGRRCVSGDDGRLTWLVLNKGYRTTYQENALAWTMMPATARGFFMQRVRWARNSYRCYLRAVFRGWLFRQPMITRVSVLQGLVAPLSLTIGFTFVALSITRGDLLATAAWAVWVMCGRGIRAIDHLRSNPKNVLLIPVMTGIIIFAMTAIKYYTFWTMNRQGWITRREERAVGEGQSSESLELSVAAPLVALRTERSEVHG
jgi:hyaluronan synthase